jgi:hypothetical protein
MRAVQIIAVAAADLLWSGAPGVMVLCHVAADMEIARECVPHLVDYCAARTVIEMPILSTGVAFEYQTGEVLAV